jgi:hypothetical protein
MKMLTAVLSLALAGIGLSSPAAAQEKPLFASPDKIHLTIQAPLSGMIHNRSVEGAVAGTLTEPNGQSLPITLQLRGITRRTSEVCDFPPLRVDFTTPPPPTSLFAGQKKLKLITHCRNGESFQQYILLEYSAYRIYNILTQHSFRAKLADIDYRDDSGRPIVSRVGFFLEDLGDVAHRNGMREAHGPERIPVADLSPPDAARYALFQHMLANHDWSMRAGPVGKACCHNAELIGALAPGRTIPVPYDFDFSGFVDPPYATPPAELDLSDVRERLYRGYCIHNADAVGAARQMRDARPQILAVLTQVPGLEPRTQARAATYLNGFFADIGSDADLNARVLKRCVN